MPTRAKPVAGVLGPHGLRARGDTAYMPAVECKEWLMCSRAPHVLGRRNPAQVQTNALMSAAELAQGIRYTEALRTSWRPPRRYREMTEEECDKLRAKWSILIEVGEVHPTSLACS